MKRSQQQTQATSPVDVPVGSATKSRRGFTLVELLVVIAIIGILIGMLAVAIGPVINTAQEGAVTTEMKQIELALENFNNQYGFYPPIFSQGPGGVSNAAQLQPFLNRISPNNREFSSGRLALWYGAIGQNLDDRSSLVFWLTGLCSNKQFPITGGLPLKNSNVQLPVTYGGSDVIVVSATDGSFVSGPERAVNGSTPIDIPRDSFFDFKGEQLTETALDLDSLFDGSANQETVTHVTLGPGVRAYNTPFGNTDSNRGNEYFYRNAASYNPNGGGYHAENDADDLLDDVYVNPNTFQLFTYGRDGLASGVPLDDGADRDGVRVNRDNITNFANGRLEKFDWKANLGL